MRIYALRRIGRSHVDEGMHFQVIIIEEIEMEGGRGIRAQPSAIAGAVRLSAVIVSARSIPSADGIIIALWGGLAIGENSCVFILILITGNWHELPPQACNECPIGFFNARYVPPLLFFLNLFFRPEM